MKRNAGKLLSGVQLSEVASSANFINIKQTTLASLLKRSHLNVAEVKLFQSVLKWIDHQCLQKSFQLTTENRRSVIGDAVYDLRFIAMNQEEFAKHVSKSGLLTTEELVPIYEKFSKLESPLLKWKLPEREKTFNATNEKIRISRFPAFSNNDYSISNWEYNNNSSRFSRSSRSRHATREVYGPDRDYLSFSVDQCALFLGVRLFAASKVNPEQSSTYQVDLRVNRKTTNDSGSVTCEPQTMEHGIAGFDVMLESPILVKENEIVEMDVGIYGPPSCFGRCGKRTVKVQGITAKFLDSDICNTRTCVSQGQFHEIILSV